MWNRLREFFGSPATSEDVAADPHVARTRETGGGDRDDRDSASTTGTGHGEEFVGRIGGADEGDVGETGAEARAQRPQ